MAAKVKIILGVCALAFLSGAAWYALRDQAPSAATTSRAHDVPEIATHLPRSTSRELR
jgi:hypothetical protein